MKVKLIIISIILLLVMVFACGCIPFMENLGILTPPEEEQLSPEKGGPPDGLVKVLIGFKEKPGPAEQAIVKGTGGKIKYTYNLIPAIAASVPEVAIEALKKNPNITNIELDSMVYTLDTELDNSWGVKRIGAGFVHDDGNNGEGIKIAVIDTGIDRDHPDLDGNLVGGVNFVSKPSWRTPDPNNWDDDNGHGTHVAGIIAAEDNNTGVVGVAPGAALYALKVLDRTGSGYVSDVVAAIQWATENDIQVINMSLGGAYDIFLEAACLLAYYPDGLILVAAAGNEGSVIYPAAYDSVIAVSATNISDELASFSSFGPEVELAAPGVAIYSTYIGGYATLSGTSMASPHVAGTAALVWAANTTWSNDDVRTQLQNTADDLGATGWDSKYGYGLVDADEAAGVETPLPGTIMGNVTDAKTGLVIGGAKVVVEGTTLSKTTDSNGNYTIYDVPVGIYTVSASADGYENASQGVTVNANTISTVDFALNPLIATSTMYVESITFSKKKAGPNNFLYTTVKVVDDNVSSLASVRVNMTLTHETSSWNFVGDTGTDGTIKFTLNKAPSGLYTATVTSLTLTDYTWNTIKGIISAEYTL